MKPKEIRMQKVNDLTQKLRKMQEQPVMAELSGHDLVLTLIDEINECSKKFTVDQIYEQLGGEEQLGLKRTGFKSCVSRIRSELSGKEKRKRTKKPEPVDAPAPANAGAVDNQIPVISVTDDKKNLFLSKEKDNNDGLFKVPDLTQ